MNKFNVYTIKLSGFVSFAIVLLCASLFCVGCGDGNFAGTSEEPNEIIAERLSSSEPSSSNQNSVQISSSSNVENSVSSSSEQNTYSRRSSSSRDRQEGVMSSSSQRLDVDPIPESSASQDGESRTPIMNSDGNSLGDYLHLFNLDKENFDNNVLAATFVDANKGNTDTQPPNTQNPIPAEATEFDVLEKVIRFVKQNVGALPSLFPNASLKYSELATSIAKGEADENCGLYMLNINGGEYAGHILAQISSHKITVLDIAADACAQKKKQQMVRFLFEFCGEIDKSPEIDRIVVNGDMSEGTCSELSQKDEWVKN